MRSLHSFSRNSLNGRYYTISLLVERSGKDFNCLRRLDLLIYLGLRVIYGFISNTSVTGRQPLGAFRMPHPVFSHTLFTPQPRAALPGAKAVETFFAVSSIVEDCVRCRIILSVVEISSKEGHCVRRLAPKKGHGEAIPTPAPHPAQGPFEG